MECPKPSRLLIRMVENGLYFSWGHCFYTFSQQIHFKIYTNSDTNISQSANKLVLLDFLVPKLLAPVILNKLLMTGQRVTYNLSF